MQVLEYWVVLNMDMHGFIEEYLSHFLLEYIHIKKDIRLIELEAI